MSGGYYVTDAHDPEAPVELAEYHGIKPGDRVINTDWLGPLPEPLTVAAIYEFRDLGAGGWVTAILNDGKYEINANEMRLADMAEKHDVEG